MARHWVPWKETESSDRCAGIKLRRTHDGLHLVGQRPSGGVVATSRSSLHLRLLGNLQRVVDLDPEVSDAAFDFGTSKQKLNGPKSPGPPLDQRRMVRRSVWVL
jgi:hypothetical protein